MKRDFYTAGSFEHPSSLYSAVTLTVTCPADGHLSIHGVCVAGAPTKKANMLSWGSVLRAVAWAAARSPAFLADLRAVVAKIDAEAPATGEGGAA